MCTSKLSTVHNMHTLIKCNSSPIDGVTRSRKRDLHRRAAPPLVLCEQSVRDTRSFRFSARKSSVLPTHVASPHGGDNAQGGQTQRVRCTAQNVVSYVLPMRTFSHSVYVTIHNTGRLHDVTCDAGRTCTTDQ